VSESPGHRRLQGSPYVDDDGSADERLLGELEAWRRGEASYQQVLLALIGARLLVPVVAMLGEVEYDDAGLARDKSSDMAAVMLTGADGRNALLGFTDTERMAGWDPQARPVPVAAVLAAATAVQQGADALLVNVGTDLSFVVEGADLRWVAAGWTPVRLPDGGWAWLGGSDDSPPREEFR
jgi:hypothetical protein